MVQKTEGAKAPVRTRQEYPEDRFDRVESTGRIGAHRVTARPRYFWQFLICGLLGFALLTTAGVFAVQNIGNAGKLPIGTNPVERTPSTPRADAVIDPSATVAVLNGTPIPNLAAALDKIITENAWGQILFSGSAASKDVAISAVFFTDPADESAARGLAAELGGISTYTTTDYSDYGAQLIVLLGADYQGPGLEEGALTGDDAKDKEPEIDPGTGYAIDPETGYLIDPETGYLMDPATWYLIDPESGQLIDPATGWLIDPATSWPVDPATGLPVDPATLPAADPATPAA